MKMLSNIRSKQTIVILLFTMIASPALRASGAVELDPLQIGVGPGVNAVPLVYASGLPLQFPSAAGFNPVSYSSRAEMAQALADGSIDGALIDIVDAILLLKQGVDIRIAAELPLYYHAYSLPDTDLSSIISYGEIDEAVKSRLAVRERSSIMYALDEGLSRSGIRNRIRIIAVEDDYAALQFLFAGESEIAVIPLPFAVEADSRGASILVEDINLRPGAEVLVFRENVLLKSMDEIIGSMRAYNRSLAAQYRGEMLAAADKWWSELGLFLHVQPVMLRDQRNFFPLSPPTRETFNYFQFRIFEEDPEFQALRFESVMFNLPARARHEVFN